MTISPRTRGALALVAVLTIGPGPVGGAWPPGEVGYPDGYRQWTHVSTTIVGPEAPQSGTELGIHHIYANEPALEGLRTGRFPDGAKLVYDLRATRTVGGVTTVGERRRLDVMERLSTRYGETGGWGFESFAGGDPAAPRVAGRGATMCYRCHEQRTAAGVFSSWRE